MLSTEREEAQAELQRDLRRQVSSLVFEKGRSSKRDYALNETQWLCLPMESPLARIRSIVGGESIPRTLPGKKIMVHEKGGDNEENT